MAKILLRRGLSKDIANAAVMEGEPLYTTDTNKLYIAGDTGGKYCINPDKVPAAATADKLATACGFKVGGADVMEQSMQDFDGTKGVSINVELSRTGVTAGTYSKVTVDDKGRVRAGAALTTSDIPSIPSSKVTGLGNAALLNIGTTKGCVAYVEDEGYISPAIMPPLAITDVFTVASEAAMLALTAQRGDVAIRSDLSRSFILAADSPSVLANWKELITPTDAVLSVAGKTGVVTLQDIITGSSSINVGSICFGTMSSDGTADIKNINAGLHLTYQGKDVATQEWVSNTTIDGGTF